MTCVPVCAVCGDTYDPDVTYATFRADFAARVGWVFDGKRPRWIRHLCSEPCRAIDIARRRQIQIDNTARRRATERDQAT